MMTINLLAQRQEMLRQFYDSPPRVYCVLVVKQPQAVPPNGSLYLLYLSVFGGETRCPLWGDATSRVRKVGEWRDEDTLSKRMARVLRGEEELKRARCDHPRGWVGESGECEYSGCARA